MGKALPQSGYEPIFDPRDYSIIGFNCYDYAIGYQDKKDNKKPHSQKSSPGERAGLANKLNVTKCGDLKTGILKDNPKNIKLCRDPKKVCGRGFFKIMSFVSPGVRGNTADFHFYRQVQSVRYKIAAGDTVSGLAKYFRVTPDVIRSAAKKLKQPTNNIDGNINSNSNLSNQAMAANRLRANNKLSPLIPGKIIEFKCNLWAHKQGWGTRPILVDAKGKTIYDPRKANRNYGRLNYTKLCGVYCVRAGKAKSGNT